MNSAFPVSARRVVHDVAARRDAHAQRMMVGNLKEGKLDRTSVEKPLRIVVLSAFLLNASHVILMSASIIAFPSHWLNHLNFSLLHMDKHHGAHALLNGTTCARRVKLEEFTLWMLLFHLNCW